MQSRKKKKKMQKKQQGALYQEVRCNPEIIV